MEALQEKTLEALLYHWQHNRPDRMSMCGDLLILLTDLRSFPTLQHMCVPERYQVGCGLLSHMDLSANDLPPLVAEINSDIISKS